jgi:hypothetical protein
MAASVTLALQYSSIEGSAQDEQHTATLRVFDDQAHALPNFNISQCCLRVHPLKYGTLGKSYPGLSKL